MAARTLQSSPSILPLYGRSAAAMIPGASLLPFVPGGGGDVPDIELVLGGVRVQSEKVSEYAKVCGFTVREALPATYPHMLAFPLHMAAMADGRFPFGAVGLVHIENTIVQRRAIGIDETLEIRVRVEKLQPHPSGRTFTILTEVAVAGEPVWEETSTMLRRGGGKGERAAASQPLAGGIAPSDPGAEWSLPGDLGRKYGAVSGDRNPIHMHPLTARPLGFPRAIAHGMWSKARCVAALEGHLADAFAVEVRFRKPILLPGRVRFQSAERPEGEIEFAVRDCRREEVLHLEGRARPANEKRSSK